MALPNAPHAIVHRENLLGYLLDQGHPDNGGKAAFFEGLGFTPRNWEALAQSLRELATAGSVFRQVTSVHGTKYVVDGLVGGPQGRQATVRTIWIIDRGLDTPRLVTAYPVEGDRS